MCCPRFLGQFLVGEGYIFCSRLAKGAKGDLLRPATDGVTGFLQIPKDPPPGATMKEAGAMAKAVAATMTKMKWILLVLVMLLAAVLSYLGWIKIRSAGFESEYPLAIKWEGLYKDKNFRDIGDSINQCYGRQVMRTGLIFRSNGWFSGWDCNEVGNPATIFSLNFDPKEKEMFYCWDSHEERPNIGKTFNTTIKLKGLESLETWNNAEMRSAACQFLREIFISIQQDKATLIHCSAGRDRTGVYSALLAAVTAEYSNMLDQNMLYAIECDYRKTRSLKPENYGRMERFLKDITRGGSVGQFLRSYCEISEDATRKTGRMLAASREK